MCAPLFDFLAVKSYKTMNHTELLEQKKSTKIWFKLKSRALVASSNEEERKKSALMMCLNHFPGAHNENMFPGE